MVISMAQDKNKRGHRWNGRVTLLAVMVGFCILAMIEIVYGQAKLKVEKERLSLEETNYQTLQALEKAQETIQSEETALSNESPAQDSSFMNAVEKDKKETEPVEEDEQPEQNDSEDDKVHDMQIVFMGDSIIDFDREYEGVAGLVSEACNADVYNMAIGGTTAALLPDERYDYNNWESIGLLGIVNAIVGNIDAAIFEGYTAGEHLKNCNFSETDYFVIEYGVNDFMAKIPPSLYLENGEIRNVDAPHTYTGALDNAIGTLHEAFPDAKIIVVGPHYCQFFAGGSFLGDGYSLDLGYGNLISYTRVCGYVAEQYKKEGVVFYNAFEESGIDAYSAEECLKDGIHLTLEGRRRYADYLIRLIKADFYPEE